MLRNLLPFLKNSIHLRGIKSQNQLLLHSAELHLGLKVSGMLTFHAPITSCTENSISFPIFRFNCWAAVCSSADRGKFWGNKKKQTQRSLILQFLRWWYLQRDSMFVQPSAHGNSQWTPHFLPLKANGAEKSTTTFLQHQNYKLVKQEKFFN